MGEAIAAIESLKRRGVVIEPRGSGYVFYLKKAEAMSPERIETPIEEYQSLLERTGKDNSIKSGGYGSLGASFAVEKENVLDISHAEKWKSGGNIVVINSFTIPNGSDLSMNLANYMIETLFELNKKKG